MRVERNGSTRENLRGGVDKRPPRWIIVHPQGVVLNLFGSVRPECHPSFLPLPPLPTKRKRKRSEARRKRHTHTMHHAQCTMHHAQTKRSETKRKRKRSETKRNEAIRSETKRPFPCFFTPPCTQDELNQRGPKRPCEDALKSNFGRLLSTPPLKFSLVLPFLSTLLLGFFGSLPSLSGHFCRLAE